MYLLKCCIDCISVPTISFICYIFNSLLYQEVQSTFYTSKIYMSYINKISIERVNTNRKGNILGTRYT